MSLKLGNTDVDGIMLGDKEVSVVYKGTDEVWTAEEPVVIEPISDDKIAEVFTAWPYTGNQQDNHKITTGTDTSNGGVIWIKPRDWGNHQLWDTERGPQIHLIPNDAGPQSNPLNLLKSFDADGFTLSDGSKMNGNGKGYASWSFQKRPGFMDIVEYEGNGAEQAIGHRLGCNAGMVFIKAVDQVTDWVVYSAARGQNFATYLNKPDAEKSNTGAFGDTWTESKFSVGASDLTNKAGAKYIAYLFAGSPYEPCDDSIIKCGSYTGTGSNQSIDLGWKPQFLFVKDASHTYNWWMYDEERGFDKLINANIPDQEMSGASYYTPTDTGFNSRNSSVTDRAGEKYIYMAIKAPPPPPPGPWGTEALSGKRECYFELQKAGVTFPTDNFTVEVWFKSFGGPNHGSYASIFGAWSHPGNNGWMFGYNMNNNDSTQNLDVMHKLYSDTYKFESVANDALTDWSHIAMVKSGNTINWYINGTKVKSHTDNGYTWGGHTQFYCGGSGIRDAAFGTYSNFRVSNIVRYAVPFSPPTSHFEPDANTLVLAHQGPEFKDYSGNNVNMVAGGGCKITQDSPWTARDTYSEVANAQRKAAKVKEAATKIKEKRDDS